MCLFLCSLTVSLLFSLCFSFELVRSFSRLCVQQKRERERAHARKKCHGSFVSLVCTLAFALLLAVHLLQRERVRGGAQNLIGECSTPLSATRPGVQRDKVRGLFLKGKKRENTASERSGKSERESAREVSERDRGEGGVRERHGMREGQRDQQWGKGRGLREEGGFGVSAWGQGIERESTTENVGHREAEEEREIEQESV